MLDGVEVFDAVDACLHAFLAWLIDPARRGRSTFCEERMDRPPAWVCLRSDCERILDPQRRVFGADASAARRVAQKFKVTSQFHSTGLFVVYRRAVDLHPR